MNEIPLYNDLLLNTDNNGILKELLAKKKNFNTLWGPEYILFNEKSFIENNAENIIELMTKSRTICGAS